MRQAGGSRGRSRGGVGAGLSEELTLNSSSGFEFREEGRLTPGSALGFVKGGAAPSICCGHPPPVSAEHVYCLHI
jgi:hypothetical protein